MSFNLQKHHKIQSPHFRELVMQVISVALLVKLGLVIVVPNGVPNAHWIALVIWPGASLALLRRLPIESIEAPKLSRRLSERHLALRVSLLLSSNSRSRHEIHTDEVGANFSSSQEVGGWRVGRWLRLSQLPVALPRGLRRSSIQAGHCLCRMLLLT